jgi:hypothetical protein
MRRARAVAVAGFSVLFLTACPPGSGSAATTTSAPRTRAALSTAAALCSGSAPQQTGTTADAALTEISGVVQSRAHPGVLWVHNDSGDSARVFAIDKSGATLHQYALGGATAVDWEDIAIAPGVSGGPDTLLLGDIGDNGKTRADVVVYSIAEPDPATDTATPAATAHHLVYPDGPHDAESLFFDPVTNDLFIVTKELSGQSVVYRKTGGLSSPDTTLTAVATLDLGLVQLVTGADIAADGSAIALRTYGAVFVWSRNSGETVADAFTRAPCHAPSATQQQGEAIGIDPNGRGYVLLSEGTFQPIWHVGAK